MSNKTLYTSAGWAGSVESSRLIFSIVSDLVRNEPFGYLRHGPWPRICRIQFLQIDLFALHSLCKVLNCDSQNSIQVYLIQIFAISTEVITV